ncbi:hypothetical protein F5876DRAFT_83880 [Lentinula aff. lateritia]|uniref:Uncharacterized protein n=1 Tax=Lentinula aff. lateritia TaxID=2804960 RepID=A0ACC1TH63_9AGAR|nr:hypothetical protein F5876DRAFT_83880 [Lentinula aff. lateritia]
MVTADNLNLDVLESIFFHLSGNDLSSVALVSRSFFAGVIPRLYRKIMFRLNHAKRYPRVMSPFNAILVHPSLATHARHIEIRTIPTLKSQLHPVFLSECTRALALCNNLQSFQCTVNAVPPLLPSLQGKERLQDLRIYANLTTLQSEKLAEIANLTNLCLDFGSWNVLDVLPRWTPKFVKTLTSLCLYMANELNETVLDKVLQQLPELQALHIVGCGQVDHVAVLRLVSHTPRLESLSLSATASTSPESLAPIPQPPPSLQHLKHLALDTRYSMMSSPAPQVLSSILNYIQSSALLSFIMHLPELGISVGNEFIEELVKLHGHTLRTLAFIDCGVSMESIATITESCPNMEHLELPIPVKDIYAFTKSLEKAINLQTIIDTNTHSAHGHGPNVSLVRDNVRHLMMHGAKLRKIVSGKRVWKNTSATSIDLSLERLPAYASGTHWFMPRDMSDFGMN